MLAGSRQRRSPGGRDMDARHIDRPGDRGGSTPPSSPPPGTCSGLRDRLRHRPGVWRYRGPSAGGVTACRPPARPARPLAGARTTPHVSRPQRPALDGRPRRRRGLCRRCVEEMASARSHNSLQRRSEPRLDQRRRLRDVPSTAPRPAGAQSSRRGAPPATRIRRRCSIITEELSAAPPTARSRHHSQPLDRESASLGATNR